MATTNKGIDYGNRKTNIDDNGLRYGVIHQNEVLQAWADDSEATYQDEIVCSHCNDMIKYEDVEHCQSCNEDITMDIEMLEPDYFEYIKDGYKCHQSQDDPDIFIEKSPYFTYAQFCSPCAPGAIYLTSFISDYDPVTKEENVNNKGYCFGHDWFEAGSAPYPVYCVKTGKRVAADGSLMD